MAEFNLILNDESDVDLVTAVHDTELDSLLSDEVVMQWLMELDSEPAINDSALTLIEPRRMNA
ncbi:MAG: hypothetical protein ACXIUB_01010 [Wenzhouxiangella sp.]